ncbi:G-protein-signaling modulator 1 [Exaiptasia diaphana]|nr:G-protein-signaling modulator 1 [Exaiptasia diaphana]
MKQKNILRGFEANTEQTRTRNRSIECFQKSLKIAEEIGDKQGEGNAYDSLGNVYQLTHNYNEAKNCHEKHLSIASDRCDKQGEGEALYNIGFKETFEKKFNLTEKIRVKVYAKEQEICM